MAYKWWSTDEFNSHKTYTYTHVHTQRHIHTHTHTHTQTHAHTHTPTQKRNNIHIHTLTDTHTHLHIVWPLMTMLVRLLFVEHGLIYKRFTVCCWYTRCSFRRCSIDVVRLRKNISGATVFLVSEAGSAFPVEGKRKSGKIFHHIKLSKLVLHMLMWKQVTVNAGAQMEALSHLIGYAIRIPSLRRI